MENELQKVVTAYRQEGIEISGQEAEMIRNRCIRKMVMKDINDREDYLPLLFKDEVFQYLFEKEVNKLYAMSKVHLAI